MPQNIDWWDRQLIEGLKQVARAYDRFSETREIEGFDEALKLCEDLNETYKLSLDLLDSVQFGRAMLRGQALRRK